MTDDKTRQPGMGGKEMRMDKLYTVRLVVDAVVYAGSASEAEQIASKNERDILSGADRIWEARLLNPKFFIMPYGWESDDVPFGAKDDETIAVLMDRILEQSKRNERGEGNE